MLADPLEYVSLALKLRNVYNPRMIGHCLIQMDNTRGTSEFLSTWYQNSAGAKRGKCAPVVSSSAEVQALLEILSILNFLKLPKYVNLSKLAFVQDKNGGTCEFHDCSSDLSVCFSKLSAYSGL